MACFHVRFQRIVLLLFLFGTCAVCGAQRHIIHYDKARPRQPFSIPRGGDLELLDEISETIHDSVMDVTIGPWIQQHTVLIIKVGQHMHVDARRP